jgi:ABC-type oligopeptide transport system substrate-binding subunit
MRRRLFADEATPVQRLGIVLVLALAGAAFWGLTQWSMRGTPVTTSNIEASAASEPGARILRRGNGPEPDSLDPALARSDSALNILRDLYEGLTTLDASARPAPGVAERWEISADGRTYTFKLRAAARWSNGDPVVAQDFVFAWQRLVTPATGSPQAQLLVPVRNAAAIIRGAAAPASLGVAATDPQTLVVSLEAPTLYLPWLLAHPCASPVHRPSLARFGAAFMRAGNAVSNGAFALNAWSVGSHVEVTRNHFWWNDAANRIDVVRFIHVADPNDEYLRYRADEIDVTYSLPQQHFARIQRDHGAELETGPQFGVYYYGFNLLKPPFRDNRALRLALSLAIDRELLTRKVTGLGEAPAYGWVPPGAVDYAPQRYVWASWPMPRRLAEARRLLTAAGYGPGHPLEIELRYNTGGAHQRIALVVAAMWKQNLGVHVKLYPEEFKVLIQSIQAGNTQVFRGSWIGDYPDAYTFLQVLTGDFGVNQPKYRSAAYDALVQAAELEPDAARRRAALEAAERQLLTDAPVIPLYFYVNKHLVKPHVHGWYDNVMNVVYSKDLSLD